LNTGTTRLAAALTGPLTRSPWRAGRARPYRPWRERGEAQGTSGGEGAARKGRGGEGTARRWGRGAGGGVAAGDGSGAGKRRAAAGEGR
jgi:hypothetical protein